MKPTDLTMLWALLSTKKLTMGERKAFQNMYDDLERGRMVGLSKQQRLWVEKRYTDLDLHGKPLPPRPAPKRVSAQTTTLLWEGKLPLKPPGRS
jgi:hypothetical protein